MHEIGFETSEVVFVFIFAIVLESDCFLENQDYQAPNLNHGCTKTETVQKCQLLCQETPGCVKFSYLTPFYDGVHGTGVRQNCCLKDDEQAPAMVMQDLVSGPAYCSKGWSLLNLNYIYLNRLKILNS